jgi:hypothetical protein
MRGLGAVLAAVAGLGAAGSALAQTGGTGVVPPALIQKGPKSERLILPPTPGYDPVFGQDTPKLNVRMMVPPGQNLHVWKSMLSIESRPYDARRTPETYRDYIQKVWTGACPGASLTDLSHAPANGYPALFWKASCPKNPETDLPETTFYKAVGGEHGFYLVQETFRSVPADKDVAQWTAFMNAVSACDDTDPKHPCPKVEKQG